MNHEVLSPNETETEVLTYASFPLIIYFEDKFVFLSYKMGFNKENCIFIVALCIL